MLITPDGVAEVHILAVCWICQREKARVGHLALARGRACSRCLRIDALLARPYGLGLLTPLVDPAIPLGRILHARLFPRAVVEAVARAEQAHCDRLAVVARRAEEAGVRHLMARWPGSSTARFLRWDAWQEFAPPSEAAGLAAYQEYAREVHPWIDTVEPRVADGQWLRELLAGDRPG